MKNGTIMQSELREACVALIREFEDPITESQIKKGVVTKLKAQSRKASGAKFNQEFTGVIAELTGDAAIFEWPKSGRNRIFCGCSLRDWVQHKLLAALDREPLTLKTAIAEVKKASRLAPKTAVPVESTSLLREWTAANRILQISPTRQIVLYASYSYLERLMPYRKVDSSPGESILSAVKNLQTAIGNYVSIRDIRLSAELLKPFEDAAFALAQEDRLVLGRYDGPRPVPAEKRLDYIEDERGELFIGVALPRAEEASA